MRIDIRRLLAGYSHHGGGSALPPHSEENQKHPPHEDDTHIYYDDLLQAVLPAERFQFRPFDLKAPVMRNPPFICFGSGGSVN